MKDILLIENIDEIGNDPNNYQGYLYIILGKQGTLQIDYNAQRFTIQAGDMLICMPSVITGHYMRTPDFKGIVFCASKNMFDDVLSNCYHMEPQWWEKTQYMLHHPVSHLSEARQQLMEAYLQLIRAYLQVEQNLYREHILRLIGQAAACEVLGRLESQMHEDGYCPSTENKAYGSKDQIFQRFNELLGENGETHREVKWYADQLRLSPKYLSAVCKYKSKKTAGECIANNSIRHMQYYLIHTDLSIKEIAFRMDFPDVSFFCKYCTRLLGKSPTAYRNSERRMRKI